MFCCSLGCKAVPSGTHGSVLPPANSTEFRQSGSGSQVIRADCERLCHLQPGLVSLAETEVSQACDKMRQSEPGSSATADHRTRRRSRCAPEPSRSPRSRFARGHGISLPHLLPGRAAATQAPGNTTGCCSRMCLRFRDGGPSWCRSRPPLSTPVEPFPDPPWRRVRLLPNSSIPLAGCRCVPMEDSPESCRRPGNRPALQYTAALSCACGRGASERPSSTRPH